MRRMMKFVSLLFLVTLLVPLITAPSMASSISLTATKAQFSNSNFVSGFQDNSTDGNETTPTPSEAYTDVDWQLLNESYTDTWSWNWTDWIFGPLPGFSIRFENGTTVTKDHYIEFDTWMYLQLNIPRNLFKRGATLGQAGLSFNTWSEEGSAGFFIGYDAVNDEYIHYSWQYSPEYDYYDNPSGPVLVNIDAGGSNVTFDGQMWNIVIKFKILSDAPVGLYWVDISITDNYGNYVSFNYWEYEDVKEIEHEYAIGASRYEIALLEPGWMLEILDMDNNSISSVAKYTDFKIRITITHPNPGLVYFSDWLPGGYEKTVTVYRWHDEVVTVTGGWVYDSNKGTFVWDSNAKVTTKKTVFGPVNITVWVPQGIDYEVPLTLYDPYSGPYNSSAYRQAFYVYNFTSGTFGEYIGYDYWNYTFVNGEWVYKHYIVLEQPIPDNMSLRFKLDLNECSAYELDGRYIVEFVAYATSLVPRGESINPWPTVYDKDGLEIYPLQIVNWDTRLTIGATTAFAYIVNKDGTIVKKWVYHVPKNDSFVVLINVKGDEDLLYDIDGVRLRFDTYDSEYTENESRWSNLIILMTYSFIENKSTIEIYNATYRSVYVYGPYWDWVLVNKTGWHYEYDPHSAKWVWTYGPYQDWEYKKLVGWHWEEQSYDRSKGNWTSEYIDVMDQRNKISNPLSYTKLDLINSSVHEGELSIYLNISVFDKVPDKSFWWNVELLNYTFGEDFSKPYGRYTTLQWIEDTVYSFMNGSEKTYAEKPKFDRVVDVNGTLYLIKSFPYIVINNKTYLLKPDIYYDPWSDRTEVHLLYYGDYNPEIGDYERYYLIYNNSNVQKIPIHELKVGAIFQYNISGVGIILSTMPHTEWNPLTKTYFLVAINGTFYDVGSKYVDFKSSDTTLYDILYISDVNDVAQAIYLNYTTILNTSSWIEYDPYMDVYYVLLPNGTRINLEYSDTYGLYYFEAGGKVYFVSWTFEYYSIKYNYSGNIFNVMVKVWDTRSIFYTVIDNATYELPYPNANAFGWWDLDHTVSDYGKVPEILVGLNGTSYFLIYHNKSDDTYYIMMNHKKMNVYVQQHLVTKINGKPIFDVQPIGYRVRTMLYLNGTLHPDQYLDIYYPNYYGSDVNYDDLFNGTTGEYNIKLVNGTELYGESEVYVPIYIIQYGNTTIYTYSQYPYDTLYDYENNTVTYMWQLINGTIYNVTLPLTGYSYEYYGYTSIEMKLARVIYLNYTLIAPYYYDNITNEIYVDSSNISYALVTSSDVLYNSTGGYYYIVLDINGTHEELELTPLSSWYTGPYDNLRFYDKGSSSYGYFLYNTSYNGMRIVVATPRHSYYSMTSEAILDGKIIDLGSNISSTPNYQYFWAIHLKNTKALHVIDTMKSYAYMGNLRFSMSVYNITLPNGTIITIYPNREYVLRNITYYGYPKGWMLLPFRENINVRQRTYEIVVGLPRKGMWGYRAYTINPDNGAIDLDGDLLTTDDQFYIKRVHKETNYFGYNSSSMWVQIILDPNSTRPDDELVVHAWMGITTYTWKNEWNETFYWYYPNGTLVSKDTLAWINSTIIDQSTGEPLPGYWDIAVYIRNYTWADVVREARERGWDWITDEPVNWTWLWFGIEEHYWGVYNTDYADIASTFVGLRYEFAGIMIYNDTNGDGLMNVEISGYEINNTEITHYFIPTAVDHVVFTTPGAAYNVTDPQGHLHLPYNASITFGIEYVDVYGRAMPLFGGYGFWDWWSTVPSGSDFEGFDERPTNVHIDNLLFLVHFQGNETPVAEIGNVTIRSASIKIDQHVGNWDVDIVGGRNVLTNRSLSINWYVFTQTEASWQFTANGTQEISNEEIVGAMQYAIEVGNSKLAEIRMGATYTWGKNTSVPFNTFSQTIPLSTFVVAYSSESGESTVTGWAIVSSMYFLSVGFPQWDGFYVYNDPETVVYLGSRIGQGPAGGPDTTGPVITDVSVIPDHPGPGDEVKIRFAAYDHESSVSEVLVLYSVNGADNESAVVTALGNDYYEATLGSFNANDVIVVYIIAKNKYGITSYYVLQITISELQTTGPGGPGFEELPIPLIVAFTVIVVVLAVVIVKKRQKKKQTLS